LQTASHHAAHARSFPHGHRGPSRTPSERRPAPETTQVTTRVRTSTVKKRVARGFDAAKNAIAGHVMRPHPAICAMITIKCVIESSPELFLDSRIRDIIGATERAIRMDGGKLKAYNAWRTQWEKFTDEPAIKQALSLTVVEEIAQTLTRGDLIQLANDSATLQHFLKNGDVLAFADSFCGANCRSSREKELAARRQDFLSPEPVETVASAK
jgi:hypothetical protein